IQRRSQQMPVQAAVVPPFTSLPELVTHEQQFLAGLRIHISEKQAQVGEPLPLVARHFIEQRALAMDDFIMRERQHKDCGDSISHTETKKSVVEYQYSG